MKTKGLKIINKKLQLTHIAQKHIAQKILQAANVIVNKYNNKSQNTSIFYFQYKLSETVPCIGNWDQAGHLKYITVPRKFYMTMDESKTKETRRKYYKNKLFINYGKEN